MRLKKSLGCTYLFASTERGAYICCGKEGMEDSLGGDGWSSRSLTSLPIKPKNNNYSVFTFAYHKLFD